MTLKLKAPREYRTEPLRCTAKTRAKRRCRWPARDGTKLCRVHQRVYVNLAEFLLAEMDRSIRQARAIDIFNGHAVLKDEHDHRD
jgi:hypothetical protein